LADAIGQALAASPAEREGMAAAGQAHVRANFTLEGMCSATLDVYRELIPGQS
jgi:glycosyltransferase involved in cell wall biosynthesis